MTEQVNENTAELTSEAPALDPSDILNAIKCIDHACDQGAYKGWRNIEQVLHVRTRLYNFLLAIQKTEGEVTEGNAMSSPDLGTGDADTGDGVNL